MSVRKRAWTTSKGLEKEAWVVDYVDQTGKRRLKTFAKKKLANDFEATANVEIRAGIHTADSASITVAEAGMLWIETCERAGLERATIDPYRQHLRLHIEPYLGRLRLSQLSAPMVREFEDRLARGDMPEGAEPRPRSPAMVRKVRVSLSALLSDAQERGLVSRNVVRELRRSRKRGKERQAEKRQKGKLKVGVDIPTREEIKAIVEASKGRWRPILLTAIFTGLRASELRGLRWHDVDLDKRELHVRQRADRYSKIGKPKSDAGERTVPLTPIVVNTLKEWKLACPKSGQWLVFPSSGGIVEHHSNIVARGLAPTLIAAGVTVDGKGEDDGPVKLAKYSGLHAFRHFYASWCINRRVDGGLELPPKVVQERLGHSSIMMTMDVYGHLFPRGDDSEELAAAESSLLA
ncbi:MAG: site-specific integrase [Hyphomicrobiales bacterium]|nr:site-specific integrase [Hyphomicrobiales bacterium]